MGLNIIILIICILVVVVLGMVYFKHNIKTNASYTVCELYGIIYPMAINEFSHCATVSVDSDLPEDASFIVIRIEPHNNNAAPFIILLDEGGLVSFQGPIHGISDLFIRSHPISEEDIKAIKAAFAEVKSGKICTGWIARHLSMLLPVDRRCHKNYEPYE